MVRRIIKIDEKKCNGCGLCAAACHEGAIGMQNGKAKLLRDDYCDGLGDCLPACPTGAITFEEREAAAYDEAAVKARMEKAKQNTIATGCPSSRAYAQTPAAILDQAHEAPSQLAQWPVQIKLMPVNAPYFNDAHLLISADCAAYSYANFHAKFMSNRITLIGCPKLDSIDYSEKLAEVFKQNNIKSVIIVRMEVPCCGGLENAVYNALKISGKNIPLEIVTLSTNGEIIKTNSKGE
ncbi:4Fe-4S binding protein [Eubacteriales bacterium OttesenSCG-928-K08]|nr:4Fe-4S binding protein [Eubacteriales bacterium OttesenSCG-928-K08]